VLTKLQKWLTVPKMAKTKKAAKKPSKKDKKKVKPVSKKAKSAMKAKSSAKKPKAKAAASKLKRAKPSAKKAKFPKVAPKEKLAKPVKTPKPPKSDQKAKRISIETAPEEVLPPPPEIAEEVVLTDAEGRRYCRVKDCDQLASVDSYCRYHYLLFWKKIQVRKKILTEGKLERYIEELTARYPDKFLEMLRKDLRSEKEFLSAIQELEIDESANESEFEDESENFIDEVRGIEPAARTEDDY